MVAEARGVPLLLLWTASGHGWLRFEWSVVHFFSHKKLT